MFGRSNAPLKISYLHFACSEHTPNVFQVCSVRVPSTFRSQAKRTWNKREEHISIFITLMRMKNPPVHFTL